MEIRVKYIYIHIADSLKPATGEVHRNGVINVENTKIMSVTPRIKKLAKGYETVIIDSCFGGQRKFESTGIKFKSEPSNAFERKDKAEKLQLVKILVARKGMDLLTGRHGLVDDFKLDADFFPVFDEFVEHHKIKDIKKFYAVRKTFRAFVGRDSIPCYEITEKFLRRYVQFLQSKLNGESPANYFAKLNQILKVATTEKYFRLNPATGIKVKKVTFLQKDVLTFEEISLLSNTSLGNLHVRNAFLFCCLTGLRFCDVVLLKWGDITIKSLRVVQAKTKIPLEIPLSEDALSLLPGKGKDSEKVFKLPSHTACQKWLKTLVSNAGIDKKISWHSGRHSFGTNLIKYGTDVSITSKLLGHSGVANTLRYINVNEEMKIQAIDRLPSLNQNNASKALQS